MNRICIFAHYDKSNIIQDYVTYYISQLKKICNTLIFVSDSDMDNKEINKITKYANKIIIGRHEEYDFGSYKRGYIYAKTHSLLNHADELIFANDSCYGPLFPIEEIFNKMSIKNLDFWGINANDKGVEYCNNQLISNNKRHIQSFFIVFKPIIFNSKYFYNFINSVKQEKDKVNVVINYEIPMTNELINQGFKYDIYCPQSLKVKSPHIKDNFKLIRENKCPFLKTSIMRLININEVYPLFYILYIRFFTNYNIQLIKKDLKHNRKAISVKNIIASLLTKA